MIIQYGRYISPPDIEAQLSPANYLYTHSLMFTYDCYTQTGINAAIKLNDQWTIQFGVHAGDDIAPWNAAAQATGLLMLRWVSKSNNDSLWGGIDSINTGRFKAGHDNLQQDNLTWTHRFNRQGTILTSTEAYYIYQDGALVGGTVNNGPPRSFLTGTGPGSLIPGNSPAIGVVNYTAFKISKHDFLTLRPIGSSWRDLGYDRARRLARRFQQNMRYNAPSKCGRISDSGRPAAQFRVTPIYLQS